MKKYETEMCWSPLMGEAQSAFKIIEASMESMLERKWDDGPHGDHPQEEISVLFCMWDRAFLNMEKEFYKAWKARNPNYK